MDGRRDGDNDFKDEVPRKPEDVPEATPPNLLKRRHEVNSGIYADSVHFERFVITILRRNESGSGHTYEVELVVTDAANKTATANDTAVEEASDPPSIVELNLTNVDTEENANASFKAVWSVSDDDGDLDEVELTLYGLNESGEVEDFRSIDVDGTSSSGTTNLTAESDSDSGHTYAVELVVNDEVGNNAAANDTAVEEVRTPPAVHELNLTATDAGDSANATFEAAWNVSDETGNLERVNLTFLDLNDTDMEDSRSIMVSGASAAGTTDLTARN